VYHPDTYGLINYLRFYLNEYTDIDGYGHLTHTRWALSNSLIVLQREI
jgi:hypothetical protein